MDVDQQLLDLFNRFAGIAYDRQQRFAEFLARKAPGEKRVLDIEAGTVNYGPKLQFQALLVGVHADHNDSWMWTWANRTIKLSLTNRALGDTVRALAHKAMTPTFAKPAFPLALVIGPDLIPRAVDVFGTILIGELDYDAYLAVKHDGNPALVMIRDDRLRTAEKYPLARLLATFPKAMATLPATDHRAALAEYAQSLGLHTADMNGTLTMTGGGAGEVRAIFDDRGRLAALEGSGIPMPKAKPTAVAKKKPVVKKKPAKKAKPPAKAKAKPKPTAKKKPAKKR